MTIFKNSNSLLGREKRRLFLINKLSDCCSAECLETLYVTTTATTPINGADGDDDDLFNDDENEIGEAKAKENGRSGLNGHCSVARCPASPITIPASKVRNNSLSQPKSPKPRRQRTTSTSVNTSVQNEAIIRANNRTIYTAGRPPW